MIIKAKNRVRLQRMILAVIETKQLYYGNAAILSFFGKYLDDFLKETIREDKTVSAEAFLIKAEAALAAATLAVFGSGTVFCSNRLLENIVFCANAVDKALGKEMMKLLAQDEFLRQKAKAVEELGELKDLEESREAEAVISASRKPLYLSHSVRKAIGL